MDEINSVIIFFMAASFGGEKKEGGNKTFNSFCKLNVL